MINKDLKYVLLLLLIFAFRLYYGIQNNFSHEDYHQIYLIGLKHYTSGVWPY